MGFTDTDLVKMGLVLDHKTGRYVKKKATEPQVVNKAGNGHVPANIPGIFIPGNVPSKKNSKQIWWKTASATSKSTIKSYDKNGRRVTPFITSSKLVKTYQDEARVHYEKYRDYWIEITSGLELPLRVFFLFVRSTNQDFDFNNATQIITDMMTETGWHPDDASKYILPMPPLRNPAYYVSPKSPGVYINLYKTNK